MAYEEKGGEWWKRKWALSLFRDARKGAFDLSEATISCPWHPISAGSSAWPRKSGRFRLTRPSPSSTRSILARPYLIIGAV